MSEFWMWARFFGECGLALGFGTAGYVGWWLLSDKLCGHRVLIQLWATFFSFCGAASLANAIAFYFTGQAILYWRAPFTAMLGLAVSYYTLTEKWHLRKTLRRTEVANHVEMEHLLDGRMADELQKFADNAALRESRDLLQKQVPLAGDN